MVKRNKSFKICIAADKDFADKGILKEVLKQIHDKGQYITEYVLGYSNEIDKILTEIGKENQINITKIPTNWSDVTAKGAEIRERWDNWKNRKVRYNAMAWKDRNQQIVDNIDLLVCIDKYGTKDIRERAEKAKVDIMFYEMKIDESGNDEFIRF